MTIHTCIECCYFFQCFIQERGEESDLDLGGGGGGGYWGSKALLVTSGGLCGVVLEQRHYW